MAEDDQLPHHLRGPVEKLRAATDELLDAIKEDKQIDDVELQVLNDEVQRIEDKIVECLAEHGLEVGDERID